MPEDDIVIEKPLRSGATDHPFAPQSGDVDYARNAASAIAAGYTIQHAPSKANAGGGGGTPRPFNDIAKGFHPDMSAEEYDHARKTYFDEVVVPRLGNADDRIAAWQRFKQNTERKSSLTPTQQKLMPAVQGLTGIAHAITQPMASIQDTKYWRDKNAAIERVQERLVRKARREGMSIVPTYIGEMVGSTPAFALAAETGGASLEMAGIGRVGYTAKLLRASHAFGLFEAANAKEGERFTAYTRGFSTGAAFEPALLGIGKAGKFLFKGRGFSAKDIDKVVTNVLSGELDPEPELNQIISTQIENDVRNSRAEGRPQFIKEDPTTKGVNVLLHDEQGGAQTIRVRPGEERSALKDILSITRKGGVVDGIIHNPSAIETLQRFMRMSADEGAERYEGVKVIRTAEGQAPQIALEHELDGKATQAVGDNEVVVQEPQRAVPTTEEIRAGLDQLRDEEGYALSKGAKDRILGNVRKLWDQDIPDPRKEVAASQLRSWDLKDLIPEEWKREKPFEQLESADIDADNILKRAEELGVSEAEMARLQEIVGKEPARSGTQRWEPGLGTEGEFQAEAKSTFTKEGVDRDNQLFQQAKRELPQGSVSDWARRAQELKTELSKTEGELAPMRNIHIPESENYYLEESQDGPRKISLGETPRRFSLRVSNYEMHELIPGAQAATSQPGFLNEILDRLGYPRQEGTTFKPVVVYKANPQRMTVYHEGLHVDKFHTPEAARIMQEEGNTAAESIAKGLKGARAYKALNEGQMREEAFVHAASAIRAGDAKYLENLVKMDGTIGDVFEMVNERAVKLYEATTANVDSALSRVLQRKMQDLILRTTDDRAWEMMQQTADLMHNWWYDPEAKAWKLIAAENLVEETHSGYAGLVESVMSKNGSEWAPSATLWAEARGVRGPIVPRGAGPVKDPVMMNTPPDAKWGGWTSISGLYRPMGPWVADLHTRVNDALEKFGKRLPIYDRFKAVDESFRSGDSWMQDKYSSAAKMLEGIDNKKQYAYFDVLATDPRHWPEMTKQMGLGEADLRKITEIDNWLGDFRNDTNILVKNYLRDEFPRLRGANYDTARVYGNFKKTPAQMSTFERLISEGKLDPRGRHIGSFVDTMLREGFSQKFTDKPLKELEKLVNSKAKSGGYVLGNMRYPLLNYTRYMRGVPDVTAQVMQKTVGEFFKMVDGAAERMNKHLPSYAQLPTKTIYPKALINKMLVWSYAAGLGLRAAIPIRDFMQVFSTSLPVLGPKKFLLGMTKGLTKEGLEFASDSGALLNKRNIGDIYGDIFNEIPSGASTDYVTKLANKLLAPSRWGHNGGRLIAFTGEYHSALDAVAEYRAGRLSWNDLVHNETSLWWNDKPVVDRIKGQIADQGFSDHDIAKNIALEALDLTLWPYRRGMQPTLLRTGAGRVFGQFGMWPMNYLDFLKRGALKFGESPKNALSTTAMWAAMNYGAVAAMNGLGADTGKWFGLSPAAIEFSPHLKFIEDLAMSPKDSQEGREARKRVLEYPLDFFPSSIELRNIGRAWDSGEDFFDGDGNLTPSALRVLGFTPLKEEPERDLEDEVLYQMGYGHEKRRH